jgi:hypothetical protein
MLLIFSKGGHDRCVLKTARVALFRDEETLYRASRNAAFSFLKPLAPVLALRGQHFK